MTPGVISSVRRTGTSTRPDFDTMATGSPSSTPASAASLGWIRNTWRRSRISLSTLWNQVLWDRSSRKLISRRG